MNQVQVPRLEALQSLSDHYSSDPYSLSLKVRKTFRQEKKIEKEKERLDDTLRDKYALPTELSLAAESAESLAEAKAKWAKEQQALQSSRDADKMLLRTTGIIPRTPSSSKPSAQKISSARSARIGGQSSTSAALSLRARILENTAKQSVSKSQSKVSAAGKSSTLSFRR